MNEELEEIIFNIMTEGYKDKVEKDKDIIDYLKEKTKQELLSTYLIYGYAGNNEYIVEEISKLEGKKKEEIIKQIINFLDSQIVTILQFFNNKRISDIKDIASEEEPFKYATHEGKSVSLDTIKILRQLNFIFCKKEKEGISVHMPKYIRDKINSIVGNLYLDYYSTIISYSKGIADTYGAISIHDAYDIIKNDILISFEKYESTIKFVSLLEMEPIYYSFKHQALCNFNIHHDEEIKQILEASEEIVIYDRKMYERISNNKYLDELKEYEEFRKFLKIYYDFDINEDEMLKEEIVESYIDAAQIDEEEAKENINNVIERYFEINDFQKQQIINYVDKIRKRMPIWKQGGKIERNIEFGKIGRNELCPCGSGKKYKNCHQKIEIGEFIIWKNK